MQKHYYDVLNVADNATQAQVKQAYKQLALVLEDSLRNTTPIKILIRNGLLASLRKFQKPTLVHILSNIVLNDPLKRENYDKYGTADLKDLGTMDFQEFMQSFSDFDNFVEEFLTVIGS